MKEANKSNFWVYIGAGISILLIVYCLVYIFNYYSFNDILWHYPKNYKPGEHGNPEKLTPNEIGDSIGGTLNPIIGLVASILTFLAFYMQKRANDDIQAQFKTQQFESQFYEMLRLHKENVNELDIRSMSDGQRVERRAAFESMVGDLNSLLSFAVFGNMPMTPEEFNAAYAIFFWGYSEEQVNRLSTPAQNFIKGENLTGSTPLPDFKSHNGYSSFLGHYYRHLFMMVKFVVESDVITEYNDKMKYLSMLRAQLSNHEQIMLFYNWLSGYGEDWENEDNQFFTEYTMIHNLWKDVLFQNEFILDKVKELENKPVLLRTKPLFEYQEK